MVRAGGKEALFIPFDIPVRPRLLLLPEGPTDTAAALTIGLPAIGRPNCIGARSDAVAVTRMVRPEVAVAAADQDAPGQRGADLLARDLVADRVAV